MKIDLQEIWKAPTDARDETGQVTLLLMRQHAVRQVHHAISDLRLIERRATFPLNFRTSLWFLSEKQFAGRVLCSML
jgi:hypothetical protein